MSSIYEIAPPTKGKVLLKTTLGDIDVELWPKEAPKAVRNFVQLCLEGYYDGCVFHRVLKDFLAQTGDPTGKGTTSESIYGSPFKDEFHSRLRFAHRGIVACANANVEHSNGSQFFITLGPTESLQKKNTIFGKVSGETIYNVMEINNLEVDDNDRPEHPPIILETEVLWNPFDDIVPRTTKAERQAAAERAAEEAAAAARPAKRLKKNVALLSFGGDGDEEDADVDEAGAMAGAKRLKSAHETLDDARLVKVDTEEERRLAAEEAAEAEARRVAVAERLARLSAARQHTAPAAAASGDNSSDEQDDTDAGFEAKMRKQALKKQQAFGDADPSQIKEQKAARKKVPSDSDDDSDGEGGRGEGTTESRRDAALAGGKSKAATIKPSRQARIEDAELLKPWELKRREYKQKRKMTAKRDKSTLAAMQAFSQKLAAAAKSSPALVPAPAAEKESVPLAYNGEVRTDIDQAALMPAAWRIDALQDESSDDDEPGGTLAALRRARLNFPKTTVQGQLDREKEFDSLEVVDPLLEKGKAAWNKQQAKLEKRQRAQADWGGGVGRDGGGGGAGPPPGRR